MERNGTQGRLGCVLVALLLLWGSPARAAPTLINHQGFLTDAGGRAVSGSVDLTFELFGHATDGARGAGVWQETHTGVAVEQGVYSVLLGSVSAGTLNADLFAADDLWLEVTVNGEVLAPRQRLSSVAYALNAASLGGVAASSYLQDGGINGLALTGELASGTIPATGAGTRLMWYPGKAAFRVGMVTGTQWDDGNIGDGSVAMGFNATARGSYSTALGYGATASAEFATALGVGTASSGFYSTALGYRATASGGASTAMGQDTAASGGASTAMGYRTTAQGDYSTAMGAETSASGSYSTAMGYLTWAQGRSSTAMGVRTTAESFAETVVGAYDTHGIPASWTAWVATDRLFVVGNGTGDAARSDAVVVLKNGNTGIGTSAPESRLAVVGDVAVSGTVDGRDVSADGAKLDTVATGAADTSNDAWTGTGDVYVTSGNVGIGTASPAGRLEVYRDFGSGTTTTSDQLLRIRGNMVADANYRLISAWHGTSNQFYVDGAGNAFFRGGVTGQSWTNSSSRDYKEDIQRVDRATQRVMLAKLMDMDLSTYRYRKEHGGDGTTKLGFIAEEMPQEVVSQDGKGVDIYELIAFTIGAMQVQEEKIATQQAENEALKRDLAALQDLKALVCLDHPGAAACQR